MANIFKIDLQEDQWVDQVFEGRNKAYGAYQLRKKYAKAAIGGGVLAILLIGVCLGTPVVLNAFHKVKKDEVIRSDVNMLKAPPPLENKPPPPPPPKAPPPPPVKTTIKFTPPVVKKDNEVKKEDIPPPVEATKKADPGAVTVKGDPTAIDMPVDNKPSDVKGVQAGEKPDNTVYVSVEQMPVYPGNEPALMGDLNGYLAHHYPPMASENGIQGRVTVQFVVEKDGSVSAVKAISGQDLGGGLADAAVAAVKKLKRFKPAKQNGTAVRVFFTVPVTFKLGEQE